MSAAELNEQARQALLLRRTDLVIHALSRPMYVYRMARAQSTPSAHARMLNAAADIDKILKVHSS